MAVAAHAIKVYVKVDATDPGASDEVDGITEQTYQELAEMLDTTDFKDTSGWHTRMMGLQDFTFEAGGDLEDADDPQKLIRSSKRTGATIYVTVHWAPSAGAGFKGVLLPCLVESFEIGDEVAGKTQFSASWAANGAPTNK